jgi:hypothetical protein
MLGVGISNGIVALRSRYFLAGHSLAFKVFVRFMGTAGSAVNA